MKMVSTARGTYSGIRFPFRMDDRAGFLKWEEAGKAPGKKIVFNQPRGGEEGYFAQAPKEGGRSEECGG